MDDAEIVQRIIRNANVFGRLNERHANKILYGINAFKNDLKCIQRNLGAVCRDTFTKNIILFRTTFPFFHGHIIVNQENAMQHIIKNTNKKDTLMIISNNVTYKNAMIELVYWIFTNYSNDLYENLKMFECCVVYVLNKFTLVEEYEFYVNAIFKNIYSNFEIPNTTITSLSVFRTHVKQIFNNISSTFTYSNAMWVKNHQWSLIIILKPLNK